MSHRTLLTPIPVDGLTGEVDAVVVPTNRPAGQLFEAIELARKLDCPLLVLCSGESRAQDVAAIFEGSIGAAIPVSSPPHHPLLEFRTWRMASSQSEPYLDTGTKRNIALLLGRLLGWRRLLFLDDDIRELSAAQVRAAAAVTSPRQFQIVGWRYHEFPDNSVVFHAARACGLPQDVFIGAGALLVELTGRLPFFPAVYNEDWLFWHDQAATRALGYAGDVEQLAYHPFDPQRANREEFGDVLAEGLYQLIHQGRSVLVGCLPAYWPAVIAARGEMLADLDRRLWALRETRSHTADGYRIGTVLGSVAAAREALERVLPGDLAEFTALWRYDLYRWNARLQQLPRLSRLDEALDWLGLTDVHLSGDL